MCRNWRMWATLGAIAVTVAVAFPGVRASILPLLLLAACPLSMLIMGVGMARAGGTNNDSPAPAPERETTVSP